HPEADAQSEIQAAVEKAKKERKHVFIQIGGNWCVWCLRFNELVTGNDTLKNYIQRNYEVVHVNYSKENKNEAVLASLEYPQRFGFPVFVILNEKGNRIHTQNSAYLEEGKGHSAKKVLEFLENWSPTALDPKSYKQ
ncbi:MAG: thioredoxin family protein, partial [Olivibacter sp.]|nr:thioredoxin family protein [Olivibacter sp. UJ_SKK_5.1]